MFNNLPNASVAEANEADILAGFGGEEASDDKKNKGDDKKPEGKDSKPSGKDKSTVKSKGKSAPETKKSTVTVLPDEDLKDAFDAKDEDDNEDDNDEDESGKPTKKKPVKSEDNDDNDDNTADDNDDENDEEDDENEVGKEQDDEEDDDAGIKDFLKARVELLLKKGEWKSFEIDGKKPEDVEWDEDTFADIELQQRAWQRESLKEELLDSFGPYGRDIAEYASNGGNPDDLIAIFQEQQEVKATDISNEEGQKDIVFKYQTEILGKSKESANRLIKSLIADKELEAEAKETKDLLDKEYKEQAEALRLEAENTRLANEKKIKDNQDKFIKDVKELVDKAEDITPEEKQQLIKVLTRFDKPLQNGQKVNEFYFKFAEFRKNLPNYLNLVRFVLNPQKFIKTVKNAGKSENAEKVFKLVRTSNMKKKVKTNKTGSDTSTKKTGFRLM